MNVKIYYCDTDIIVCQKLPGISSENDGMPSLLSAECSGTVYPVHRLDQAVGGLMVYARSSKAAAELSRQITQGELKKEYYAVLDGVPAEQEGCIRDLLFHDVRRNKTFVVDRKRSGVKAAELSYRVVETVDSATLVRVALKTGRSHQIRVQFASRKLPLLGDGKYGSRTKLSNIALYSCMLSFSHPGTGKAMCFEALPDCAEPWSRFPSIQKPTGDALKGGEFH